MPLDPSSFLVPARRGPLRDDATGYLISRGHPGTADHVCAVADEAARLARRFGADVEGALAAGLLHDISAPIPNGHRVAAAEAWGIAVLPEERQLPMIVHQRLSAVIARRAFGISDPTVLSAIGCHTTLKPGASTLDKIVFVADKIAWDQPGQPPWLDVLRPALDRSIDAAALAYLEWLWERRATLVVIHPWFRGAYLWLKDEP
ncbi:MAG: bis(5'-nucleosyl)-tetraphosphatase (symmetrical) YqeK [Thermoflexales bacterium]|nr:bis(5'-nucleosyl)-tetraphosphatase (symmetrical) YqeK [Thermoflexales bacterium]